MSRERNADGISRSGGQESEALMGFLASVKEECKPPVYSAFICLMNAYHGNMLTVDALLDELYTLFSPRVFLLAGIKPLVDKVHHSRIDDLCGKVCRDPSFTLPISNGENTCVAKSICSGVDSTLSSGAAISSSTIEVLPGTPIRDVVGLSSTSKLVANVGSPLQSSPIVSTGAEAVDGAKSAGGAVGSTAGSPVGSKVMNDENALSPGSAEGVGEGATSSIGGENNQRQPALGILSTSPCDQALATEQPEVPLSTQGLTAQDPISDMDPSVDHALLDFIISDNSPTVGASGASSELPLIATQQLTNIQQQQQQFQQNQHGPSTAPWSASASPVQPSVTQSHPGSARSSNAETSSAPDNRRATQSPWHRSESAPNLALGPCHIHAVQTPGCRDCQMAGIQSSSMSLTRRSSVATGMMNFIPSTGRCITVSRPKNQNNFAPYACGLRTSSIVGRQNNGNVAVGTVVNGSTGSSTDLETGYLGPGKRVWEERVSTSSSSAASASPASFFFPSAAAAAATAATAAANGNPSRLNLKRRISKDMNVPGVDDERDSSAGTPVSGNTIYTSGPTDGALDSDALSREFAGISTAGPIKGEGFGRGTGSMDVQDGMRGTNNGAGGGNGDGGGAGGGSNLSGPVSAPGGGSDMEKLVMNVATKGMQQALQYGLRHTFTIILEKKDREIAELKEEALRWSANDTRLRQMNQQLLAENMQLRQLWEHSCPSDLS